jgi:hypothetical protein
MSRGRSPEPLDFFIWTVQVLRLLSFFVLSFNLVSYIAIWMSKCIIDLPANLLCNK